MMDIDSADSHGIEEPSVAKAVVVEGAGAGIEWFESLIL